MIFTELKTKSNGFPLLFIFRKIFFCDLRQNVLIFYTIYDILMKTHL